MCANKNYWFQVVEVGVEFILFACFLFSIFILFLFFGLHLVSSSFFQFPSSSCVCGPCVMCMCISRKEYVCGICVIQRCLWIPLSNKCESSIVEYKLKYGYSRNRFFFLHFILYMMSIIKVKVCWIFALVRLFSLFITMMPNISLLDSIWAILFYYIFFSPISALRREISFSLARVD